MANLYTNKIQSDDGNVYYVHPKKIIFPADDKKYVEFIWKEESNLFKIAYFTYGDANKFWILLALNNITDPYALYNGKKMRFLLPEYEQDIEVL